MIVHGYHFKETEPAALKLNLLPLNFATSLPPTVVVNSDSAQSVSLIIDLIVNANKIKFVSLPSIDLTR